MSKCPKCGSTMKINKNKDIFICPVCHKYFRKKSPNTERKKDPVEETKRLLRQEFEDIEKAISLRNDYELLGSETFCEKYHLTTTESYQYSNDQFIVLDKDLSGHPIHFDFGPFIKFECGLDPEFIEYNLDSELCIYHLVQVIYNGKTLCEIDPVIFQYDRKSIKDIIQEIADSPEVQNHAPVISALCYQYCSNKHQSAWLHKKAAAMFNKCGLIDEYTAETIFANKHYLSDYCFHARLENFASGQISKYDLERHLDDMVDKPAQLGFTEIQLAPNNNHVINQKDIQHGLKTINNLDKNQIRTFSVLNELVEIIPFLVEPQNYQSFSQHNKLYFDECIDGVTVVLTMFNADKFMDKIAVKNNSMDERYIFEGIKNRRKNLEMFLFKGDNLDKILEGEKNNQPVQANFSSQWLVSVRIKGKSDRIFCGVGAASYYQVSTLATDFEMTYFTNGETTLDHSLNWEELTNSLKEQKAKYNVYVTTIMVQIPKKNIDFINDIDVPTLTANATFPFTELNKVNDDYKIFLNRIDNPQPINKPAEEEINKPALYNEYTQTLNNLVGLKKVKTTVNAILASVKANQKRVEQGFSGAQNPTLHMVFLGNSGTGKTTVARILGNIFYSIGALKKKDVVECSRAQLVAGYMGQTSQKAQEIFNKAIGGILFIDEAYSIKEKDNDSYGQEVINTLVLFMENHRNDTMVILAGYPTKMENMLSANPGLKNRIPLDHYVVFEDYSIDELNKIFDEMVSNNGFKFETEATKKKIYSVIQHESRNSSFGNARGIRNNIFEPLKKYADQRYINTNDEKALNTFTMADVTSFCAEHKIHEHAETSWESELNSMVGIKNAKTKIKEFINTAKINRLREIKGISTNSMSFHMIFLGNPGTGKTETARIVAKALNQTGITSKNIFVEASRSDLVGIYVGQTAPKVKKCVEKALGGVLFIDEGYSLYHGKNDEYGLEAIDTLITEMENHRDNLVVIIAGYSKEMKDFLQTNPGLKSRFPNTVEFNDYTLEELTEISQLMLKKNNLSITPNAVIKLRSVLERSMQNKDKNFGNARVARNIVEQIIRNQNNRIASMITDVTHANIDNEVIQTIEECDVYDKAEQPKSVETNNKKEVSLQTGGDL